MRFIKRIVLALIVLTIVVFVFRQALYSCLITYKSVGQRATYSVTDNALINYIEANTDNENNLDVKDVIKVALAKTSALLCFSTENNNNDPNRLFELKQAHCVGYASFFTTTCNYLLAKNNLNNNWAAKPQIGKLLLFEVDIHQYFNSPFFKDHDFVIVENKETGEVFAVDPVVNDYLFIEFIRIEE